MFVHSLSILALATLSAIVSSAPVVEKRGCYSNPNEVILYSDSSCTVPLTGDNYIDTEDAGDGTAVWTYIGSFYYSADCSTTIYFYDQGADGGLNYVGDFNGAQGCYGYSGNAEFSTGYVENNCEDCAAK